MAYFEKRQMKNGTFAYRAQIKRKGMKTINGTFDSDAKARAWAKETEDRLDSETYKDMRAASKIKLREGLERYLTEVTPKKKGARQEIVRIKAWLKREIPGMSARREFESYKGPPILFSDLVLSAVTPELLAQYRNERMDHDDVSSSTVRSELSIISCIFIEYDYEWGLSGIENPVKRVRLPKLDNDRDRRLRYGEMSRLVSCASRKSEEMATIIPLLVETAMRRSELLLMTRDQVCGTVAKLPRGKNGERRDVPLSKTAQRLFSDLPVLESGKFFALSPNTVSGYFPIIARDAGCDDLTLHDLRHEACSILGEKGLNVMEMKLMSGHKTTAQLERYTHPSPKSVAKKLG